MQIIVRRTATTDLVRTAKTIPSLIGEIVQIIRLRTYVVILPRPCQI